MLPAVQRDKRVVRHRLFTSLISSTDLIDSIAMNTYRSEDYHMLNALFAPPVTMSSASANSMMHGTKSMVTSFRTWVQTHEEAQVMMASILVVVGLWWLVRTMLALIINLICPILVVILAVMCIPQLRAPLLGQNYPLLANLLRDILLKMAENIKT
ncbi:unnamed protein product [Colias eurytheme]|nr:unnamed protein product [Colias eurytheme]